MSRGLLVLSLIYCKVHFVVLSLDHLFTYSILKINAPFLVLVMSEFYKGPSLFNAIPAENLSSVFFHNYATRAEIINHLISAKNAIITVNRKFFPVVNNWPNWPH